MEINNNTNKGTTPEQELCSLSEVFATFCTQDHNDLNPLQEILVAPSVHNELNPLQEIFGAPSGSKPTQDVTENIDQKPEEEEEEEEPEKKDDDDDPTVKRQRYLEYRVVMEKKRRQLIRDKVDTLQELTPNCAKSDLATKLENIIEYIRSLQHQIDVMSMAYAATPMYAPPYYGAQAPCMPPWGYYTPGIPMMPPQNMPTIPPFHQVPDMAAPDQTKPYIMKI